MIRFDLIPIIIFGGIILYIIHSYWLPKIIALCKPNTKEPVNKTNNKDAE